MTSGPLVAIIAEGDEIIETFRKMAGPTNPSEAMPGQSGATLQGRGDQAQLRMWSTARIVGKAQKKKLRFGFRKELECFEIRVALED